MDEEEKENEEEDEEDKETTRRGFLTMRALHRFTVIGRASFRVVAAAQCSWGE